MKTKLKILIMGIFFLVIIGILIFFMSKTLTRKSPDLKMKIENTENQINTENNLMIEEINTLIKKLASSNFDYTYNIKINKNTFNYTGTKYDDIYKGNFEGLDTEINYQIENDLCYDLNSKKEIYNVHNNVNLGYIDIINLCNILKDERSECKNKQNTFECNSVDNGKDIKLELFIDNNNNNIERIKITDNKDFAYDMEYRNINTVDSIKRLMDYYVLTNVYFKETDKIINEELEDIVFNFYNVSKISFTTTNNKYSKKKLLNNITLAEFLQHALYKIEKYNCMKYIYKDDLIIYVVKNKEDKTIVYASLEKYNYDILDIIEKM